MFYAIVTFGRPATRLPSFPRYTEDLDRAKALASAAKGTGTCTAARVVACPTRSAALSADISVVREGETIVFEA